jgi:fructoselysine and glucoselysine-specific PTS system IIA component
LIIGSIDNVFLIQAYVEENVPVEKEIKEILNQVGDHDEFIIFCDILGGSVTNQMLQHALKPNVYIVSGFNLPLLIDVLLADTDRPLDEIIEEAIINAKEQMVFVNKLINTGNKENQHD